MMTARKNRWEPIHDCRFLTTIEDDACVEPIKPLDDLALFGPTREYAG